MKNVLKNNKGFSLVEMLIVIGVMAILTGIVATSVALVNNANVSRAAKTFESLLNQSRTQSMAKGSDAGKLTITKENGKVYGQIGTGEKELICSRNIDVYFNAYNNGTSYTIRDYTDGAKMADGDVRVIRFATSGVAVKNSTVVPVEDTKEFCKLIFAHGNRKAEVTLYRETGKHDTVVFY